MQVLVEYEQQGSNGVSELQKMAIGVVDKLWEPSFFGGQVRKVMIQRVSAYLRKMCSLQNASSKPWI